MSGWPVGDPSTFSQESMNETCYQFHLAVNAMVKRMKEHIAEFNNVLATRYGSGVLIVGAWDNTQCEFYNTNLGVPHDL